MTTNNMDLIQENGHGGNIHLLSRSNPDHASILDFSANINPLGPPSWLRSVVSRELSKIVHYPDPDCFELAETISRRHNLNRHKVIVGNGTTELLYTLPRALKAKRAVIPVPCYIDYLKVMDIQGTPTEKVQLRKEDNFTLNIDELASRIRSGDVVVLGSPNNPTACVINSQNLTELSKQNPEVFFVVDEAFLDFIPEAESLAGAADNIITLHSMTKFFAVPGLRLGYGIFPDEIAKMLHEVLPPWTVNTLAQAVGKRMLTDKEYADKSTDYLRRCRKRLSDDLSHFKELHVFPSQVNYLLIQLLGSLKAPELRAMLLRQNIAIRVCDNYEGLDDSFFRIAVRTREENDHLIHCLKRIFHTNLPKRSKKKPCKSLMIQGTSSNAGKSVIVAALCRILIQDGVSVAPFKAQNMSLNSFVTHDGFEMGRAQVVQAQAAKLDPDVRMNPVLLKPNSDVGSQIIVNGKPVGNMSVSEYVKYKFQAGGKAVESFDSLASEHQVIILEGAGSPGEVNLKSHDIVNMQMARYSKSPVILVGDIDRGGVYASFVGTMEVLEEWERNCIAGFLVNRFRGDASLLESAHQYVLDHTGVPVIGTVPYIKELGIPEEDSVSFKEGRLQKDRPHGEHVEIALINLPHISNFTDIEPFLEEPDVYLRIVDSVSDLNNPDSIIIPGSKNVIGDLDYLEQSRIGAKIKEISSLDCEIVGICGGYQILGKTIADPYSIESNNETRSGLQLLDIETTLDKQKTLTRRIGRHTLTGLKVFGYEIHHGISHGNAQFLLQFDDGEYCGAVHPERPIWGAYLHGVFDSDDFRRWYIDGLRRKKGLLPLGYVASAYNLEQSFDKLADTVRHSIDMDMIYHLLEI